MGLPDFLIIGAMKCGTSTLQVQLAAQPGIFMTEPKEPNFFSDDAVFARGMGWYQGLFEGAGPEDLKGEASTHYTKLPTHPRTLDRLVPVFSDRRPPKLVYMIRNPVDRAVSHYIHEWTMGQMGDHPVVAFNSHPELIAYGRYGMQIAPWIEAFGVDNVLLSSLEALRRDPQALLDRIGGFLGLPAPLVWQEDQMQVNASAERIRRLPLHGLLIDSQVATTLRRTLVPKGLRDRVRRARQMADRPRLPADLVRRLEAAFAEDHAVLSALFPGHPDIASAYPFLPA